MAVDRVQIANEALLYLNQKPITLQEGETWETFNPTNGAHAAARTYMDSSRRKVLTRGEWGFAKVKRHLQDSSYCPIEARWTKAYEYPADCLKFIKIVDQFFGFNGEYVGNPKGYLNTPIASFGADINDDYAASLPWLRKWEIITDNTGPVPRRLILTNLPDSIGEFIVDIPEVAVWPQPALDALVWHLASRIGYLSSGKTTEAARAYAFYRNEIDIALTQNANEDNAKRQERPSWLMRRRSGY